MNRAEKQALIENVNGKLQQAEIALVVHNNGLTVAQMTQLRRNMREVGADFKVAKNRLVKLAVKNTKFEGMADMFKGPSAIATSSDPVSVAKSLVEFAKANEKLVIVGGAFGDQKLDVKGVEQLAKLPSLNELRGKLVGLLQAPAQRIACVLQAPGGQVARVISAKSKKED